MKKQLVALSFLVVGLQGVAHASFPADAEWSQIATHDAYAAGNASWGVSKRAVEAHNPFPFGGGYIDD